MTSYKVVEVTPAGELALATRELLPPATGQVRIAVEACGICHTDSIVVNPHDPSEVSRVPGHEVVGRIDAVGDGVEGWIAGDRVGLGFLAGPCGNCESCRRGNFTACVDQPQSGVTIDGGYAEVVYARPSGLVRVPEVIDAALAAPLLCAGITVFNALRKAGVKPGDVVAIHGVGGLGHLGIQYAKSFGATVIAVARGEEKRQASLDLGATHYIDAAAGDPAEALLGLGGADIIVTTVTSGDAMGALVGGLRHGGRFATVGATAEPFNISSFQLIFGNITLLGSLTGSPAENEDNLAFAATSGIEAIIERTPFDQAVLAYDRMMRGDARYRMVLTTN